MINEHDIDSKYKLPQDTTIKIKSKFFCYFLYLLH